MEIDVIFAIKWWRYDQKLRDMQQKYLNTHLMCRKEEYKIKHYFCNLRFPYRLNIHLKCVFAKWCLIFQIFQI